MAAVWLDFLLRSALTLIFVLGREGRGLWREDLAVSAGQGDLDPTC